MANGNAGVVLFPIVGEWKPTGTLSVKTGTTWRVLIINLALLRFVKVSDMSNGQTLPKRWHCLLLFSCCNLSQTLFQPGKKVQQTLQTNITNNVAVSCCCYAVVAGHKLILQPGRKWAVELKVFFREYPYPFHKPSRKYQKNIFIHSLNLNYKIKKQ